MEADIAIRIAVLEAVLKEKEHALRLQAEEYERRLDSLNHEHARASAALGTYVPRETYYSEKAAFEPRIRTMEKAQWVLAGAVTLMVFIVPILIHFWKP